MYASFLNLHAAGRDFCALHLKLFTVPSSLTTFCEVIRKDSSRKSIGKKPGTHALPFAYFQ